jgi:hypothetical protein
MTREILPFFVALLPSTLWGLLLGPLLLQSIGVPVPLKWRERKHMQLSLDQSMLYGVIGWGVAVIIFHMTHDRCLAQVDVVSQPVGSTDAWAIRGSCSSMDRGGNHLRVIHYLSQEETKRGLAKNLTVRRETPGSPPMVNFRARHVPRVIRLTRKFRIGHYSGPISIYARFTHRSLTSSFTFQARRWEDDVRRFARMYQQRLFVARNNWPYVPVSTRHPEHHLFVRREQKLQ